MENNTTTYAPLRFGILCNGTVFKDWQALVIEQLIQSGVAVPVLLITDTSTHYKKQTQYFKKIVYKIYTRFAPKPASLKSIDISDLLKDVATLPCKTTLQKKYDEYFADNDIQTIKSYNLDFMLRFGFNIIKGDILSIAKYGVWSYHHDDEKIFRGGPAGLWEIYYGKKTNGVILQRLTDTLDGGIILQKGFFKTQAHCYREHQDLILYGGVHFPIKVCRDIQHNCAHYFNQNPCNSKAPIKQKPTNILMKLFVLKLIVNRLLFVVRKYFTTEQWAVGYINKPIEAYITEQIQTQDITFLPTNKTNFLADAFGYMHENKLHIIAENYNYKNQKGVLSLFENTTAKKTILEAPYHIAYPFITEHNNELWCIPETNDDKSVQLFSIDKQTNQLHFHSLLLDQVDAVDTTLFYHNNYWWLFFTSKRHDTNTNLFAWYSKELTGPYQTHKNNPIKTDVQSARPAGTPFTYNNKLYRPAQDSSITYGGSIRLMEITELTPTTFKEVEVNHILPLQNSMYNKGIHTISKAGNYTIIDCKRHLFIWQICINRFKVKFTIT